MRGRPVWLCEDDNQGELGGQNELLRLAAGHAHEDFFQADLVLAQLG
jgi:hypothetical protein